jgi:hypothetical protein
VAGQTVVGSVLVSPRLRQAQEELRLDVDPIPSAVRSTQPRRKRLLVGEAAGLHRMKFRSEDFRVGAADAEDDERAGVAEYRWGGQSKP